MPKLKCKMPCPSLALEMPICVMKYTSEHFRLQKVIQKEFQIIFELLLNRVIQFKGHKNYANVPLFGLKWSVQEKSHKIH